MPEDTPRTRLVVPAGLTQVVLAAGLIPNSLATRLFSSFTHSAANRISSLVTSPAAMPVILTPSNASASQASFHW